MGDGIKPVTSDGWPPVVSFVAPGSAIDPLDCKRSWPHYRWSHRLWASHLSPGFETVHIHVYIFIYIYILYAEVLQYCDVLYCSTIYLKLFVFLLIQSNSYDIAVASMYVARLSPSEETARSLGKSMNIINKMVILLITGPRHLKSGSNIPIKLQTFTSCPQS